MSTPVVVMLAILSVPLSVNQSSLSGPAVILAGCELGGRGNSLVSVPVVGLIRPILLPKSGLPGTPASVNQMALSGPVVIPHGRKPEGRGTVKGI